MINLRENPGKPNGSNDRQQGAASAARPSGEWRRLLLLSATDQPVTAVVLLVAALSFGGWYIWRATTVPGLIELQRTEPSITKLVVNINTAEAAELMLLPEIGKTTSVKIIDERKAHGLFRNAQEFGARIKGIGPKTLPKITPFLEGWTDE